VVTKIWENSVVRTNFNWGKKTRVESCRGKEGCGVGWLLAGASRRENS
jgi:hypothetical protein